MDGWAYTFLYTQSHHHIAQFKTIQLAILTLSFAFFKKVKTSIIKNAQYVSPNLQTAPVLIPQARNKKKEASKMEKKPTRFLARSLGRCKHFSLSLTTSSPFSFTQPASLARCFALLCFDLVTLAGNVKRMIVNIRKSSFSSILSIPRIAPLFSPNHLLSSGSGIYPPFPISRSNLPHTHTKTHTHTHTNTHPVRKHCSE